MHSLGHTRSVLRPDHLLQTPDTFVRTPHAGGKTIVHISPAGGAGFTQYTLELEPGGVLEQPSSQRLLYVLTGTAEVVTQLDTVAGREASSGPYLLRPGSFAYFPERHAHQLKALSPTRLAVIEKPYLAATKSQSPAAFIRHEDELEPVSLGGDPDLLVRALMPDDPAFDFAVNTMTYAPGASLAQVEIHVMEHGLLMLEGGGIYRLSDGWYPVTAGDFIWMAPFCPQWFGALGKVPAKYLIYKDWNRTP